MKRTRRRFLALGAATTTTFGIAGCIDDAANTPADPTADGAAGDGESDSPTAAETASPTAAEQTDTPTAEPEPTPGSTRPETPIAGYQEWLPDPAVIDQDGYAFMSMAPRALREFAGDLGDGALEDFDSEYPVSGVGTYGEMTALHHFARASSVIETSLDRPTVEDSLAELGFTEATTHRGFTVFTASDSRAAGVGDDALVTAGSFSSSDDADKRPVVEAIVDARTGNADRYIDVDPDCDLLVEALGNAHVLQGRTHDVGETFDGAVGEGVATHVGERDTRLRASVVFAEDSVDESAVADWAADAEDFQGAEPVTSVDGRTVDASATVPTGDVSDFPDDFPGPSIESDATRGPPQIQFDFEYEVVDEERGLLTVSHYGGDAVPASELFVEGDGFTDVDDADQTDAGEWQGTTGDEGDVMAGDFVDLGVTSDCEIRLVWRTADGDDAATIATFDGPDA